MGGRFFRRYIELMLKTLKLVVTLYSTASIKISLIAYVGASMLQYVTAKIFFFSIWFLLSCILDAAYVGLATITGFVWWFVYSDKGPKLPYYELVICQFCLYYFSNYFLLLRKSIFCWVGSDCLVLYRFRWNRLPLFYIF